MLGGLVSVVSPGAYTVSDGGGDVVGSAGQGLFYRDTRHLSRYVLRLGGETLLSQDSRVRGSEAEFSLVSPEGGVRVVRRRVLGDGMREEIRARNDSPSPVELRAELECDADFMDIFEVRGYHRSGRRREVLREAGEDFVCFAYENRGFRRRTRMCLSGEGVEPIYGPGGVSFVLQLGPGEERVMVVCVTLEEDGREIRWDLRPAPLYGEAPELRTGHPTLLECWNRSITDLETLSFEVEEGLFVPAAGAPWYMALFGRDALITAFQTIVLGPEPAKSVLRALARYQAEGFDDFRDAEPGKVLHELRLGELALLGEVPHSPYYGTADATPLFLILLNEIWRWTADDDFVRELESPARRALDWVFHHADRTGDGHVAYATRSAAGLKNHCWRDDADSMLFRDGTRAEEPVAPCELQGYVYDAFLRTAQLAEQVWGDASLAVRLRAEAGDLGRRFDRDFWMEDRGYYALALDGAGRRVDSLASSAGHLLWSGIVPVERARVVADRLMSEELFSGWGVRTMAEGEGGYDPDSYHNGSVWPHDNALIAYGLRRYGLLDEVSRISAAILGAAPHFDHRLPEVFAGYSRSEVNEPVELPGSCSPQAWAAGTVPLLVRAMLGVEPEGTRQSSSPLFTNLSLVATFGRDRKA